MYEGETPSLQWRLVERGLYRAIAPWGARLELERRRSEAGEPSGWYLFGELGTGSWIDGRWLAERRDAAMVAANQWLAESPCRCR
jgi:hypothetical protein